MVIRSFFKLCIYNYSPITISYIKSLRSIAHTVYARNYLRSIAHICAPLHMRSLHT